MKRERASLLADLSITGRDWCGRYTRLVDEWLAELFESAHPPRSGVALIAVGGYGRAELCPFSDIDLMLAHDKRIDASGIASGIWYPIWDAGLKLGHSVSTVSQALRLASDDVTTATALLDCRLIGGDETVMIGLAERAGQQWRDRARRRLDELERQVELRHRQSGEVAFLLEPDLKEGRGGMRDVHALSWAQAAHSVLFANDEPGLDAAYSVLLDARVELQRATRRSSNVLTQQDQAAVAAALGHASADVLMGQIAAVGRTIAWVSDDTWRRIRYTLQGPPRGGTIGSRRLGLGLELRDGEIHGEETVWDDGNLLGVLRVASASAQRDLPIERATLARICDRPTALPGTWPAEARTLLENVLLAGRPTIGVVEALDHCGIWQQILPEWANVRSRPQHNPYHRFTVDRHLLETVANASELASTVERPDLLAMAALLHDLGKSGEQRDHTEVGIELAGSIATRLGYPTEDVETLVALVQHHLLLSDIASRRDLDDPTTIELAAAAVASISFLELLAALTEADAKATGPTAWSSWKAHLVGTLVARVASRLRGETLAAVPTPAWPHERDPADLANDVPRIVAEHDTITVIARDHPGLFSRVAGVLALRGLDVLEAAASTADGWARSRFRVTNPVHNETPWAQIIVDLERALDGQLAIDARLADRAREHARRRGFTRDHRVSVTFDNVTSNDATVVDIEAPDTIGILYRITKTFSDLDLNIRSAKVQTLGVYVVDAFYVCDRFGQKVESATVLAEVERAVVHAVNIA